MRSSVADGLIARSLAHVGTHGPASSLTSPLFPLHLRFLSRFRLDALTARRARPAAHWMTPSVVASRLRAHGSYASQHLIDGLAAPIRVPDQPSAVATLAHRSSVYFAGGHGNICIEPSGVVSVGSTSRAHRLHIHASCDVRRTHPMKGTVSLHTPHSITSSLIALRLPFQSAHHDRCTRSHRSACIFSSALRRRSSCHHP